MNCCTPKCEKSCYNIDINQITGLINGISMFYDRQGEQKKAKLYYNFGKGVDEHLLKELSFYKDYLIKYKERLIREAQQCVCPEEIQIVIERVIDIVPKELCGESFEDLVVDDSNFDAWLIENPNCSGAAEWEKLSYKVCTGLGLQVKLTPEKQCKITFDISRNLISCELLYAINIVNQACRLGYEVKRTKEECKLDWKLLLNRVDCNLSLHQYSQLIDKGLTYDIILQVYEMGASLSLDGNECLLRTESGAEYTFSELDLRKIPTIEELTTEFTSPSNLSLDKYINDYKLTQDQINSLKNG